MASADTAHPELISDDPRRNPDNGPEWIERVIRAATEQHGVLLPRNLVPDVLQVARSRVGQLIDKGVFTVIEIAGQQFLPLREVMKRRAQQESGELGKGGRGVKATPLGNRAA